jgi:hypothetical protein
MTPMAPHEAAIGSESLLRRDRKPSEMKKVASGNPTVIGQESPKPYRASRLRTPMMKIWSTRSASPRARDVAEIALCTLFRIKGMTPAASSITPGAVARKSVVTGLAKSMNVTPDAASSRCRPAAVDRARQSTWTHSQRAWRSGANRALTGEKYAHARTAPQSTEHASVSDAPRPDEMAGPRNGNRRKPPMVV